ncbi:UPF0287-domain-containing protein [Delitschia confertaspora ATCC 74209]|uniref:COX assembly mitochondrial protein n=1 Tax=Delitschia confertaspora ATCC 74209 TaxID=1513339 RepID=A0A9P4JNF3_9PLEO|nr:UPF0287-domain-containing protein [Delitschia confertaspora ATCC 74209]
MHPHLHNEQAKPCEDLVAILEECHAKGFMWKVFGNCTTAKYNVNMCLRAQRLARTAENRQKALEKRKQIESVWKDIDENS